MLRQKQFGACLWCLCGTKCPTKLVKWNDWLQLLACALTSAATLGADEWLHVLISGLIFRFTPSQWETVLLCNDVPDPIRLEIKNSVSLDRWSYFDQSFFSATDAVELLFISWLKFDFTVQESCLNFWLKSNIGLQLETAVSRDVNAYLLFINPIFFTSY